MFGQIAQRVECAFVALEGIALAVATDPRVEARNRDHEHTDDDDGDH
jgi:hypothetical protein